VGALEETEMTPTDETLGRARKFTTGKWATKQ
jgi:hypothetical protein